MLTSTVPSRSAARVRVGIALVAACWLCMPAHAQTGAGGLGSAVGLGAALLALMALQGSGASIAPAASLGVVALALLSIVALSQWRRRRPAIARGALLAPAAVRQGDTTLAAEARVQFLALQAAWDGADVAALGALTTDEMLAELLEQLPERGPGPNRTDVLSLQAWVLRVENLGGVEVASIEFSGMVRESPERGPVPFRELWMLARRDAAQPWRLARQQALM